MTFTNLGVQFDDDYRGRLATRPGGGPTESMSLGNKLGFVVHYAGGAQNRGLSALARWQSYARWHIRDGGFSGFTGNGIMYHGGASEEGGKYLLYDPRVTRWHAGSGHHNRFYVSLNVPIGGDQKATPAQMRALEELIHAYIKVGVGQDVKTVIGHQEASWSLCPGTLQHEFVHPIRNGQSFGGRQPGTEPDPADKPDHLVIQVPDRGEFWINDEFFKRWALVEEPLFIFGYPLDGAKGNPKYQDFERARMHIKPDSWTERWDTHLALVGFELAKKKVLWDSHPSFKPIVDPKDPLQRYFPQTMQAIYGRWKGFYEEFGGVEYFGFPISGVFNDPDTGLDVQYFQRARLEWHQNSDWHKKYHQIGLGLVNAELKALP